MMNINEGNFVYHKMFDKTNKIHFLLTDDNYRIKLIRSDWENTPFTVNLYGKKFVIDLKKILDKFDIHFGDVISVSDFEKMPIENRNKLYTYVYPSSDKKPRIRTLEYYIIELFDRGLVTKEDLTYEILK